MFLYGLLILLMINGEVAKQMCGQTGLTYYSSVKSMDLTINKKVAIMNVCSLGLFII